MYIYMAIEICADVACEGCYITYIYIYIYMYIYSQCCTALHWVYMCMYIHYVQLVDP